MKKSKLLINGTYWPALGHAVEAIRLTRGYKDCNPDIEISLLLNADTPAELAECCPWVDRVFRIPVSLHPSARHEAVLANIPTNWDYLIGDDRLAPPIAGYHAPYQRFHEQLCRHVGPATVMGFAEDSTLPFERPEGLRIPLPAPGAAAREAMGRLGAEETGVAVLLAGGSLPSHFWPSKDSWIDILRAVARSKPEIRFFLLGNNRENPYLKTQYAAEDAEALLAEIPAMVDCRHVDLLGQLAIVEACRLFVSPHTGFAFAAMAVGTPWLTISGGRYREFFFTGVPFLSLLPDAKLYPAYTDRAVLPVIDVDGSRRIPSMKRQRFIDCGTSITEAASMLIDGRLGFADCLSLHWERGNAHEREVEEFEADWLRRYPDHLLSCATPAGTRLDVGDRVLLHSGERADAMDIMLEGHSGWIKRIEHDCDGRVHVEVVLEEGLVDGWGIAGQSFFFSIDEVERAAPSGGKTAHCASPQPAELP